jgi:hypothetical protein
MRRWAIVNALLGLFAVLLTVEIVRTWARALPPVGVTPGAAGPVQAPEPHEKGKRGGDKAAARAEQTPEALVAAVVEKDAFDPSRHPPAQEAQPAPERVTEPPTGVTLVGVRILGKDREAFLTDANQGNVQRRLRAGDEIAGYTVKTIEPAGVTLTSPSGDAVSLLLSIDKSKPPPPPPGVRQPGAPGVRQPPGAPGTPQLGGRQPFRPPNAFPAPNVPPGAGNVQAAPGQNPQAQGLPADVRQKLERLKRNDNNPRPGRRN